MGQKQLKVCITGAAGQIGYSFIPMVCSGAVFGDDVQIDLRLLDIPDDLNFKPQKKLQGIVMEIQDCAYPLIKCVSFGDDPNVMFKDIDVGIFIGGFPRKQGMERKDLLSMNGSIFKGQGAALNAVANPNVKCLVVANPANTNCLLLQQAAVNIPKENFSCLTRLDQNRACAQIAQKTGNDVRYVRNITIWGNHSSTQFPDVNHGTVKSKTIREAVQDNEYLDGEFISKVQKRGAEILNATGGSSVFSAANAVKDHLKEWYRGSEPGKWCSMGVITDGKHYDVPEGLCFSFPIYCRGNFKYDIVEGLKNSPYAENLIKTTLKELQEEKADAYAPSQ